MIPAEDLARFLTAPGVVVPPEVRERAKGLILDSIGVMVLGSRQESYEATITALQRAGLFSHGTATVYCRHAPRTSDYTATLVNATAMHLSEMGEGVSRAVVHASNSVVPAALAVAESEPVSGGHFVDAVALALETTIRFGLTVNRPADATDRGDAALAYKNGWWTPSVLSGLGAATVVGLLKGLTAEQLVDAWGIAANCAPATSVAYVLGGASGKGATMGLGCAGGLLAAHLAASGLSGQAGLAAWSRLLSTSPHADRLSDRLGDAWEVEFPLYKYIATVGPLHAAIEAALVIAREERPDPRDIESVEVLGYDRTVQFLGTSTPHSEEAAKTSLKHTVAVALVTGDPGAFVSWAFEPEARHDSAIGEVAGKVTARVDPTFNAEYPIRSARARVVVRLASGAVLAREVDRDQYTRYHHPSRADLEAKFNTIITGQPQPSDRCRDVIESVWQMRSVAALTTAARALLED